MRRLKTVRRPPIYPKTPGHLPYSLTHPLPLSSRRPSVSFGGFGLRMNVSVDDGTLAAGTQAFKLQFSTSTSGGWQDVGDIDSATIWRGFDEGGATTIDGDTIPSLVLTSSMVAATYEDSNPSASNPNSIAVGDVAEWDWVLQSNTAPTATYFFRMVLSSGTALASYTMSTYPELSTVGPTLVQSNYRWFSNVDNGRRLGPPLAAQNEPYNQSSESEVIRLRINMQAQVTSLPQNGQAFKLQYSATTTGGWTDFGDIGSGSAWRGYDNTNSSVDGDRTRGIQLDSDERESYEEENPTVTNPRAIATSNKGEWDWVIQNFSALPSSSFYFRMVRADGTPLDSYENYPAVTTTNPVIARDNFESGGFSGGAGWSAAWTTSG